MVIGLGIMTWLAIMAGRGRFDACCYTPVEVAGLYSGGRRALFVIQARHRSSPPRIRHWPDPLNGDAGANVNSGYTDLQAPRR